MHYKRNNKESKTYVQGLRPFGKTLPHGLKNILKKNTEDKTDTTKIGCGKKYIIPNKNDVPNNIICSFIIKGKNLSLCL